MFTARPPDGPAPGRDLPLARIVRRAFTWPAEFLADPENRARTGAYLADLARPYAREVSEAFLDGPGAQAAGQSYGEMAGELIGAAVRPDEPVDLLILAFSEHDVRPGRQTAAYLSHLTPGAPMAFAICDQGPAAAFSALRVAREYASSAGVRRALLVVVEQAALPYDCAAPLPSGHRAVAMLYGDCPAPQARVTCLRQHASVAPAAVAGLAAASLAELTPGREPAGLVLGDALAAAWTAPAAGRVRAMPPGQPSTATWWGLADELSGQPDCAGILVVADYDPRLRYLSLAAFDTSTPGTI